jgi:hypothetical protein
MSSPFPTLVICLSYAYFVKVLGPRIMENRKPMNLRVILIIYNFVQVIFSSWLFYEVTSFALKLIRVEEGLIDLLAFFRPSRKSNGQPQILTLSPHSILITSPAGTAVLVIFRTEGIARPRFQHN